MIKINDTNVTVMVTDMNKAVQFYESIGMVLKQRWDDHYAMVTAPGVTIGLHPHEGEETNSGTVSIGFMVDSVEEAKTMLDINNIAHDEMIDGKSGTYLYFKDPFGTVIYFVKAKWLSF